MRYSIKIALACLLSIAIKAEGQELTFLSPVVEEGVRQHLNITEDEQISFLQLDTITTLDLSRRGVTDIHDLVLLPNLRYLDLSDNMVEDLRPLTILDSLEWVDLSYNNLKGINDLFYSSSKNLTINVAFNYIKDFSLFGSVSSSNFVIEGAGFQQDESASYFDVYYLFMDFDKEGNPVVAYRGSTNLDAIWSVGCDSTDISVQLDGDDHTAVLPEIPRETTAVILSNGEVGDTTYIVPVADYTAAAGESVILETGLPEDYRLAIAYALKGTVEIIGTTMKYTAPSTAVSDVVNFCYYKESTLKGFSRYYLNTNKIVGDVNGDGSISVTDVGMMISFILGQNPVGFNEDAADLNGDRQITVTDVGALITKILTGN